MVRLCKYHEQQFSQEFINIYNIYLDKYPSLYDNFHNQIVGENAFFLPEGRRRCHRYYLAVFSVCVFFPFILGIKFVGHTSRGHTGGRSHRISHPPSFCGACLNFSREKDSAIPFPRRP